MNASPEVCADLIPARVSEAGTVDSVPVAADLDVPAATLPKGEAPFPFLVPVIVACLVGQAAMFGQMFVGLAFEVFVTDPVFPPGTPRLSYGAPGMWLAQTAAAVAGVFGLACGLAYQKRRQIAGFSLAFAAGFLALVFVTDAWRGSQARYGYDPSDWPCFVAPFFLSVALTALSAACLAFFAVTRTLRFVAVLFGVEAPAAKIGGK